MHDTDEAAALERAGAVEPDRVKVWVDEFQMLHVQVDDTVHDNVRAVRVFPISGKADYVSFLTRDDKEIVLLHNPHRLDKSSRRDLEKALDRMYYVARIKRIDSIAETMGVSVWKVETDRGYASFEVVHRDSIRKLAGERYLIADADGNRFEIENLSTLDPRSQTIVQSEI